MNHLHKSILPTIYQTKQYTTLLLPPHPKIPPITRPTTNHITQSTPKKGPTAYIEYTGKLTFPLKAHDAKLSTRSPAFTPFLLTLSCPELGPSDSTMKPHHTQVGTDSKTGFPNLTWDRVEGAKEYILLCEDADLPIPTVVIPGLSLPNSRWHYGCCGEGCGSGAERWRCEGYQ